MITEQPHSERSPVRIYSWRDMPRVRHSAGLSLRVALDVGAACNTGAPIQWASFFPGAYQVVQTDLGLTYGGTMLASGTTPPVITLTGSLAAVPVPIRVECTLLGVLGVWTGRVSFDGGSTFPQTFTSAATVALTGAGAGLTLNIAAGAAATNDVWLATCAGLADQSGNGRNNAQAGATAQPIVAVGLNGKPELLFDGVNDKFDNTAGTSVVFPYQIIVVARRLTPGSAAQQSLVGGTFGAGTIDNNAAANSVRQFNGGQLVLTSSSSAYTRFSALFTNSTADTLKVGSIAAVTGTNTGANAHPNRTLGASASATFANVGVLAVIYTPPVSLAAFDAALNSTSGYGVGSIAV